MRFKLPFGSKNGRGVRERLDGATDSAVNGVSSLISHVGSGRLGIVLAAFLVVACIFMLRLIYLQVIVADTYSAMASESRTVSFDTTPRRGTIYDRNGLVLATSVDATTIYANPSEVTDVDGEAAKLAEVLGGEQKDYIDLIKRKKKTFVYIKRQVDNEVADRVKALDLDGIYFIEDTKRTYPNGAVGGQVIGFCNVDGEGITGLELQYDDVLRGTPGTYTAEHGLDGIPIPGGVHEETAAVDGEDIVISLDIKLQEVMEDALKNGLQRLDGKKGTSLVMDGATGEIYACCSVPLMDPTNMAESEVGSDQVAAITQAIEPGSIFKTVTCLESIKAGVMEPETVIHCPSVIEANDYEVTDAHPRPDVDWSLRTIMNKSSNVGISLIAGEKLGFNKLNDAIVTYGFAERTGVDYPGEAAGMVQDFDNWARIVGYNVSFGQGITVTPLQMTRFYAAIANDGVAVQPHFLLSMPQTGYKPLYGCERVCFDTEAMDKTKSILRTVVTEGTGKAADIEGYEVVGKTSTAEIAEEGGYSESHYNLAFTGFIDNSSSKLVCYVGANDIAYESSVTDVFKAIMSNAVEQYNVVTE